MHELNGTKVLCQQLVQGCFNLLGIFGEYLKSNYIKISIIKKKYFLLTLPSPSQKKKCAVNETIYLHVFSTIK